jgi:hypothetical protein
MHADEPAFGLYMPAGQGTESPEYAGQKQPVEQGVGGVEDEGGQKKPGGHGLQIPVPLV